MAQKSENLKSWDQLKGKKVCLIQGSFYNKELQEKYGVEGVAFPGTAEAYAALKNGNCVAFAYDDTAIIGELQKPEWTDYDMPLDSILFVPWGLAVKQGEKDFADFMSKTITDWHKTGMIQQLEKKWGIKPTKFAAGNARQVQIAVCAAAARRVAGVAAASLARRRRPTGDGRCSSSGTGFGGCTRRTGINLTIFYDAFDRARFATASWMTIKLSRHLHRAERR